MAYHKINQEDLKALSSYIADPARALSLIQLRTGITINSRPFVLCQTWSFNRLLMKKYKKSLNMLVITIFRSCQEAIQLA